VNVESEREVHLLGTLSQRLGRAARVAVRLNPDYELKSSGMKMGGGPKQFGIDVERVPEILEQIGRLRPGSKAFIIPDLRTCAPRRFAKHRASASSWQSVWRARPAPVRSLNLGGGFGIPYFPAKTARPAATGAHLHGIVARATTALPEAELVIELGRFLVGEAGVYVARVVDRKISRGEVFLVTDGGLHHHLAASGNFGQVIRKNYPV
jgi:diaminopimelate decarboxylase